MIHINAFKRSLKNDRGQVGIGTLIIFIAMVLVAAVAAGVLINTSGQLQARATDTGNDAQAQVSNQIDVVNSVGTVEEDGTSGVYYVTEVALTVKKSPGSGPLDLTKSTVIYTSSDQSFTMTATTTPNHGGSATVLESASQRGTYTIDVDAIEGEGLGEGESATLKIVDQSGATTTYVINAPDTLHSGQSKVLL